jgi:hypothetical protein
MWAIPGKEAGTDFITFAEGSAVVRPLELHAYHPRIRLSV